LKKAVTPIPPVIFDHIMSLGLNPEVEANQCNTANPPNTKRVRYMKLAWYIDKNLIRCTAKDRSAGTLKQEKANMQ
jgi:hypothetical protein